MAQASPMTILIADDDPDDRALALDAFAEVGGAQRIVFVEDGVELLAYLRREGRFADSRAFPMPELVLLDLNMPRLDGREALREIKGDPWLRHIPVVVLSTSHSLDDVAGSYRIGASSFITKPVRFDGLVEMARTLSKYWFETVDLPRGAGEVG